MREGYSRMVRSVDRYVGSCICFIFTLFHTFRFQPRNRTIKNVLVIELVEMGASVMAYSSLAYIKKTIPEANIYCLCLESTKEPWKLLDNVPTENVIAIDNKSIPRFFVSLLTTLWMLRSKKIDMVIDYELFTRVSSIISFLIKTKFRAGFFGYTTGGLYRGNFLDVKCNYNQNLHIAKNLLALTKSALAEKPRYYNWDGPISNDEILVPTYVSDSALRAEVQKKLRAEFAEGTPFIAIAPTVGKMLPMRDYPKEQYVEVIKKLLTVFPRHNIVLVGMPAHSEVAEFIRAEVKNNRCFNFCGKTASLRELLELFLLADLLISNDSGNPHFAAMAGLKTVALFGPETPFMYGPLGKAVCLFEFFHTSPSITSFNHKNPPQAETDCLRSISPNRVVEAAQRLMEGKTEYRTVNNTIPYLL